MSTLLVELAGPEQAWGSQSRFASRGTETAPTRSGVIGLIAAALGLPRSASLERFDCLEFGVRVDQPGEIERDFHTARSLDGSKSMPLSQRYYLADAVFLAGLSSSDESELVAFREALASPKFPLYLGRRAFPPAGPLVTEIVPVDLRKALTDASWRARAHYRRRFAEQSRLEMIVDARPGETPDRSVRDAPRSFDQRRRRYDWRDVRVMGDGRGTPTPSPHDPFLLVSEEEV